MKKLLMSLLASIAVLGVSAETRTFTVASLNVDGMPPSLLGGAVKLNPDAKESAGATAIGENIRCMQWDIVALSEDFNYHDDIMNQVKDYYYSGTFRGKLYNKLDVLTSPFDTDGLGFLYAKHLSATGEKWTRWNKTYGKTSNGSDQLIKKGFR